MTSGPPGDLRDAHPLPGLVAAPEDHPDVAAALRLLDGVRDAEPEEQVRVLTAAHRALRDALDADAG